MDFKALLSKKVAGVPIMWIILVVALVGLYGAIRLKPAADTTDETDIPEGDTGGDGQPIFRANEDDSSGDSSLDSSSTTDTNAKWSRRAVEWLVANGTSLSMASGAIAKYLNGETLSQTEGVVRDKAVKQFGLPPEGDLATSNVLGYQGPATRQGVPPVTHTVKGRSDDTFKELAHLYYGIDNADAVTLLMQANTTVTAPFAVGTRIRVVEYRTPRYYTATGATRTLYAIAAKNGTTAPKVQALNPKIVFPVAVGHRVRIR